MDHDHTGQLIFCGDAQVCGRHGGFCTADKP